MTVIVQGKSMAVTQALRNFAARQAQKISKLTDKASQVTVYLEKISSRKSNDPQSTEVRYHVQLPGKDVVVKARAVDMYDAIVDATDRVVRQVRKLKEKRLTSARQQS